MNVPVLIELVRKGQGQVGMPVVSKINEKGPILLSILRVMYRILPSQSDSSSILVCPSHKVIHFTTELLLIFSLFTP